MEIKFDRKKFEKVYNKNEENIKKVANKANLIIKKNERRTRLWKLLF